MQLLSHGAEWNMGHIFSVSHILQLVYELLGKWNDRKRGKYEKRYGKRKIFANIAEAMCDN